MQPPPSPDDFALQLALERGMLSQDQVVAARARVGGRPGPTAMDVVLSEGLVTIHDLARLIAEEAGCEVVDLREVTPAAEALAAVPRAIAARYGAVPLGRRGGALRLAVADPLDVEMIDGLAQQLQVTIEPVVAPRGQIPDAIDRAYGAIEADEAARRPDASQVGEARGAAPSSPERPAEAVPDDPVIRLVRDLITDAIRRRASDIHLEPLEQRFRIRYRIDGILHEVENPPKPLQAAILSHLKLSANLSIAEKRVPQDGRLQVVQDGRRVDLRVSSMPTVHGESIVMRILEQEGLRLGWPELGFSSDDQAVFEELLSRPDGMLLVTGPTGAGKSTTLYSALHHLNRPDRKIITAEDPVEYQLAGINQVAVRPEIGMTFAAALRAMLRQAPNIVMIGEIRDRETTEIAIQAALTGHLVFSTLHTNDAPGAVTRLIDLGAKPFLVGESLRAVLAQRLVRRVCDGCAQAHHPSVREQETLGLTSERLRDARCRRGGGCAACDGTGYHGRLAILEIFIVNEQIHAMIHDNASASRIREAARSSGMRTLREDGIRKALSGLTTLEEVMSLPVGSADPNPLQPSPTS